MKYGVEAQQEHEMSADCLIVRLAEKDLMIRIAMAHLHRGWYGAASIVLEAALKGE